LIRTEYYLIEYAFGLDWSSLPEQRRGRFELLQCRILGRHVLSCETKTGPKARHKPVSRNALSFMPSRSNQDFSWL
jgi:hypothetical protein